MLVETVREFLGIPKGSIGVITETSELVDGFGSCKIKFECKTEPILIQYPANNYYNVLKISEE